MRRRRRGIAGLGRVVMKVILSSGGQIALPGCKALQKGEGMEGEMLGAESVPSIGIGAKLVCLDCLLRQHHQTPRRNSDANGLFSSYLLFGNADFFAVFVG